MKILPLIFLVCLSSHSFAQDMKPFAGSEVKDRYNELQSVLAEDDTDSIKYQAYKFTCYNFSQTLYLQRSSAIANLENFDLPGIKEDWGNVIIRREDSKKLPIYILTLTSVDQGFYHSINAVLVKPNAPESIESYIFVEPQTDEIFETPKELINHYAHHFKNSEAEKSLEMDIGAFTRFSYTGSIYQSTLESILKYDVTL